jgi:hypothetical protein
MGYESLKRDIDWFTYYVYTFSRVESSTFSKVPIKQRYIAGDSSDTLESLVSSTVKRRVYYGISNLLRLGASDSI